MEPRSVGTRELLAELKVEQPFFIVSEHEHRILHFGARVVELRARRTFPGGREDVSSEEAAERARQ